MTGNSTFSRRVVYTALGVLILPLAWQLLGISGAAGLTIPALSTVLRVFFDHNLAALLARSALATVSSAAQGLLLGTVSGIGMALLAHATPALRPGLDRMSVTLNAVPAITLGPIFILMVSRDLTPTLLATIPVFFLSYVSVSSGLRAAPKRLCEMMTTFGAGRLQRLFHLEIPFALPSFLSGVKVSVTAAMIGAIVGEWFGAPTGLGIVILNTMQNFQIPLMWATVLLTATISVAGYALLGVAERYVTRRFS